MLTYLFLFYAFKYLIIADKMNVKLLVVNLAIGPMEKKEIKNV